MPVNLTFWSGSALTLWKIVSQFKNDLDFLNLVNVYGVREYKDCIIGKVNGNLYYAVKDELAQWEIDQINEKLKQLKISYQF